jgi:hypothetical protein
MREGDDRNIYEMLDTLDVAIDEFKQLHNDARIAGMKEFYAGHINQLNNIITLINKMK